MANYYTDHPEYDFYLNHPEMKRVVELKERNFADKEKYEDAPVDFEDAIETAPRGRTHALRIEDIREP